MSNHFALNIDFPFFFSSRGLDALTPSASEKFLWYDYRCQSEPIRQVKGVRILGIASCPVTEKEVGKSSKITYKEINLINLVVITTNFLVLK